MSRKASERSQRGKTAVMELLWELFNNVEWYVMLFGWITVPLGFFALYLVMHNHYGFFQKGK